MDLPSFESYFTSIKTLSLTIGLIILKPRHRWTKFDWIIYGFGCYNVFVSFYSLFCYILQIINLIKNEQFFFLIGEVPGTFWSVTSCLNAFILLHNYEDINKLANQFETLYTIDWTHDEERRELVNQLRAGKRWIIFYQRFFIAINLVFSFTPLITSILKFIYTGNFQTIFIAPTMRYPFDKIRFYWLAYAVEVVLARVSTLVGIVTDVIVCVFIVHLSFHFECLGTEINYIQMNRKQLGPHKYRKSFIRAIQLHLVLIK